jgi:hypothetical protein
VLPRFPDEGLEHWTPFTFPVPFVVPMMSCGELMPPAHAALRQFRLRVSVIRGECARGGGDGEENDCEQFSRVSDHDCLLRARSAAICRQSVLTSNNDSNPPKVYV